MIDYEHTGLQTIKALIPPESGIRTHPALQLRNLLVVQPAAESDTTLDFPGIEALPLAVEDFDSYGLNVECTLGTSIGVQARFDEKVVSPTYITRVLDQFAHIVTVLCDPSLQSSSLRELDLLSRADQAQIAVWNATVPQRVEKCIHELVEEQAQARPVALAVWAWDGQLSYRELTHLANLLAHRLVALGVGPERMVGVSMAKSKWAGVALLATLQAGGVVVPLSVSHPVQRIETILGDAAVSITLVDGPEYDRLNGHVDCSLLVVDSKLFEGLSTTAPTHDGVALFPPVSVTPSHAAWVIYTSGTTGTPKGAVLEHGTLCTSIRAHGTRYGFGPHTRKLQYAAHTFDGTIEDYFTTWAWGGLSCVPSEEDRLDMRQLTAFMRQTQVNALATTYTVAGLFTPEETPSLRTLVLGGEPATVEVTDRWRTKVNLFNCYGPSECSIFSSAAGPVQNIDEIHNIGTPIGTRLWVADPHNPNRLCPVGAPGELLIEGPQLARGYLNNAEKTKSQFLVDLGFMARFGLTLGRRVYRSGDIVRQKDDGSFVYVARRDTQVKIRGQRVEIGEIEQQIVRYLAETRFVAAVLLQRGAQVSPVLVAAIEFMPESRILSRDEEEEKDVQTPPLAGTSNAVPPTKTMQAAFQDLHSALFQVLPTHMIPSAYVPVAHMPRNLSGKLDRRALREQLAAMSAETMQQYLEGREKVAPATDMERTLQRLWVDALGFEDADSVSVQDNFFQLGGDSVAAMHLAALTWQRTKLHLTVADVFRHPRLGDLAQRLTELSLHITAEQPEDPDPEPLSLWDNASPEAVSEIAARCQVDVDQIEDIYPCTPLQEGFMAITGRQSAAYISRQVYSLSNAVIDLHRFQAAWEILTQTTPILRTRLMMGPNQQALQVVVQDQIVWRFSTDLAAYIAEDREAGMKLDQPLVRYGLVTESTEKTYFVWTAHHSIYDGWTMREIAQRFAQVYDGVSGRNAPVRQIRDIAGPTLTTVPVRVSVDKSMTVGQLLQTIQEQATEMIPHEQTGLQKIKRLLPDSTSSTALALRNLLVIQPAAESDNSPISLPGLEALPAPFEDFGSFGLQIECTLGRQEIDIDVQYDEHVIATAYIQKVVDYFVHLVKELANLDRLQQPLHKLHISPQDEQQILDWNRVVPTCVEQCIHTPVYDRVVRQSTACAISAWDGELTYVELSGQAASLAAHLRHELGVKPERTVGVCMNKSKWAAVAILAVLYAGGVVVPLGAAHPLPRVQAIAQDAAVETVLVDREQQQRLAPLGLRLLTVDEKFFADHTPLDLAQTATLLLASTVRPHNMAWIIYTSGSTGTPKGVILEHQALSTSIKAHGAAFNMNETTRTLQFAAHTFDATIQDVITTLWAGGCVCIPSEHDRVNRLTEAMSTMRVNCATLTSTVASMLVPKRIPSMRTMILVGEPVTAAAVALWSPHATVLNAYGPSECSIHSSCSRPIYDAALASNIGFPLACAWWVVDADSIHALCPIGAPGELLIEGPNQARGYLNDDEKTQAAFVQDPEFIPRLGLASRRLYRTGDLVKQNPDGSLIHLGRRDLQVKIRGQRIEVGEIEYQIQRHLAGARTVAVERVQHGGDGEQISLVAVLDFVDETHNIDDNDGADPTATTAAAATDALQPLPPSDSLRTTFNELRQTLLRILPVYMVPVAYLPVDQMPSNANNKLDRRAIRALLAEHSLAALQGYLHDDEPETQVMPVTALEKKVHALWLEVFDLPAGVNMSMNDNFFHRGGDSVTAMRMVVVAASHGLHLSVEDIFKSPRLADLAATLAARPLRDTLAQDIEYPAPFELWKELHAVGSSEQREKRLLRIASSIGVSVDQIEDVYPCTPLQEGLMAITARQPAAYVSRQVYAMGSAVDRNQFQAAWETLSGEVSILRTRILVDGESPAVQVVVRDNIHWQTGTDLEQYLQADRAQGMSLGQPLVRYGLVEEPTGACYFIWTAHHALYDGWTVGALSKRLLDIYRQGQSALSVPYTQFIRYLQHGRPDPVASTHYWREQLEGDVMASWPRRVSDKQPLPQDDFHQSIPLPPTQRHGRVTISTILRAAWALVVAQYSGHGDIAFAATVSGRNAPVRGISDIAGPTITTVPIRTRVDLTSTVADYVDAMQRQATHMIDHEHTGLQGIKALLPALASTLHTGSLLVIQLAEEQDSQGQLDFPGLETVPLPVEPFNAHALTLECQLGGGELTVDVHYDKQIIPPTQVKRVIDYFACLFHRLCDPSTQSQPLAHILNVDDADQQQILHWNTDVPTRLEKCIHEMVREQVERSPTAIAIHAWDGDLTYREYYEAGARVAHQIVACGVGPESIVGVCMEKSKWGAVAMLGIMQAGGAIMPLGISHPLARIDTILDASQARLIVVSPAQAERLQGLTNLAHTQLLTLDQDCFDTWPQCQQPPETGVTPSNASWAIFTSGSTGVPKGVVIEHGTMSTSLDEQGRWLGLTPATRFLQFASYTFDNVITDTFATTAFGGVVCIPSEEARMNQLTEVMADMEVNTAMLTSTPTQTHQLSPLGAPGELWIEGPFLARGYLGDPMSRNLSGKLDRKLLRTMLVRMQDDDNLRQYRVGDGPKVAPSTEMERQLQTLWADGLHLPVDEIGAHDNFFHLGGDSLAAMRMVATSRSRPYKLSVADIFKYPCLSELADVVSARSEAHSEEEKKEEEKEEEKDENEEEGVVPFSLIETDNPEAFIHEVVSPVCNIGRADDVVDILPTTDFQALTVAGVLMTPGAANCAHFLLDGQGPCDVERLRKSCLDLIRALPILRTAYIFDQSRLLQVVKSVYEPDIPIFHTERTLESKTAEIVNHQLFPAPCLGEPFTQMAIIEEAHTTRHRLLLRVTHAEYDAVSINAIWETLRCLYEGSIPPRSPSFASFYYHQQQRITAQTYDYWTDLLAGSSMPQLGRSVSAIGQYPSPVAHLAPRTVPLASPLSAGVTSAVLVKAAWAVTLARVAQRQDVVFADTVSTRGTVDASQMNATGCCVTLLPVRVQLSSPDLTARELLQAVREQQIQSFEHGHLGFRDILHDCTDWATSTRFTSALNHITAQTGEIVRMRGQEYTISSFEAPDATWTVDVGVTAVTREDGALDLRMAYRPDSITTEMTSEYLRMLAETLVILVDEPSRTVKEMLSAPVAQSGRKGKKSSAPVVQITERISGEDPLVLSSYLQIKQRPEWEVVLQRRRGVATGKNRSAASFAQRGGDLLDAVYLASLLGPGDKSSSAQAILVGSRREDEERVESGLPLVKAKRLSLRTMWTSARKSYARWFTTQSRQRSQASAVG
ncbi:acetyl-CoA synthetase-like protein [Aspergillus violaceofuscus CBS 115571]|uniref:Acetyl-CoA synthetase-like protein n=1 Tax=Aspergillus violaceofuscus (strain CBS 115571) TaxID=1450538 RepID=A0A2V5H1W9_ASPV1|nr:acetyl-CoA synthetase-like protein [Aspergillus violaceofuscus CBS 115571]